MKKNYPLRNLVGIILSYQVTGITFTKVHGVKGATQSSLFKYLPNIVATELRTP